MNEPVTVKEKILYVWQRGGPRDPDKSDELKSWLESFFPGEKYKSETVARRARELREANIFGNLSR
jgi:hypothetical protein